MLGNYLYLTKKNYCNRYIYDMNVRFSSRYENTNFKFFKF